MRNILLVLATIAMAFLIGSMVSVNVAAQSAVIDEAGVTVSNDSPKYSDSVTITVPVIFVDAEAIQDGVVLKWKVCTHDTCEIPTTTVMADNGDGTYSATIGGPFPSEDAFGEPYVDFGYTIEVTYTPIGGGEEQTVKTDEVEIWFDEDTTTPADDDDDTDDDDTDDDDDGEEEDSPFGLEVIFIGALLVIGVVAFRRRK